MSFQIYRGVRIQVVAHPSALPPVPFHENSRSISSSSILILLHSPIQQQGQEDMFQRVPSIYHQLHLNLQPVPTHPNSGRDIITYNTTARVPALPGMSDATVPPPHWHGTFDKSAQWAGYLCIIDDVSGNLQLWCCSQFETVDDDGG